MFPHKTALALINSFKVLLSCNYNFYTATYICVLGSQKNKASITFALTTKASRNRTTLCQEYFFITTQKSPLLTFYCLCLSYAKRKERIFLKRCWNHFICCFLTAPIKVKGARQKAGLTYMVISRLSYYIKGKLIKEEKKKYHTTFSFLTIIFQFSLAKYQPITN